MSYQPQLMEVPGVVPVTSAAGTTPTHPNTKGDIAMTVTSVVLRKLVAYVATAFGIVTQAVPQMHLPVAVSAVLTACAPAIESIEHWAVVRKAPVVASTAATVVPPVS